MKNMIDALIAYEKHKAVPTEFDYFGNLIGSWHIDYINRKSSHVIKGEWHFSWILEGMAIQDVITLPKYELGTTLRMFNPNKGTWDIAYCYTGKIIRLEARKQENMIVLTDIDDERRKWVFVEIDDTRFHWQDITVNEDEEWDVNYDLFAKRM